MNDCIHLRVNHCGIEIVDDDNNLNTAERAAHRCRAAIAELQRAVDMLEADDPDYVPLMVDIDTVLQALRRITRAVEGSLRPTEGGREMNDGLPVGYDEWRTRSREDEEDIAERKRKRRQAREERADDEHDRRKYEGTQCPPHYCDNQGLCHYCGILMEPDWNDEQ